METPYNPYDPINILVNSSEMMDKIREKQIEEGIITQEEVDEWKRRNYESHLNDDKPSGKTSVWDKIKDVTSTGVDWFRQIWHTVKGTDSEYDSRYDTDYPYTSGESNKGMWIGIAVAIVVLVIIIVLILKNN